VATVTRTDTPERPGADLHGAARHSVANLAGVGFAAAAAFALNIVVARGWSGRDVGLFFVGTSAFLIADAASRLGSTAAGVYFVSRYRALGQPERIRASLLAGAIPVAVVSTALAVAGWLAAPWLAHRLLADPLPAAVPLLRTLALFLPIAALGDLALAACRGFGRMRPLLMVERVGRTGGQFVGVTLAAVLGLSVATGLPLAWALPYLPATVVALVWLWVLVRRAERATLTPVPVRAEFVTYWTFAGPRALSGLAQIAIQRVGIVLLGALRGLAEAGVYAVASRFLIVGQLAGQGLATAVQHRFAAHLARDDRVAAGRLYQAATGWLVLLSWPAYLLFALFAEPMLALFGPGFISGRGVTVILALTMLVATGCGMVDTVLNMAGKTAWTFYNALAACAITIVGYVVLIPPFGMVGAAVAWAAAIVISNVVPLTQLYVAFRLHPFGRGTVVAAALSVGCFGVPAFLARTVFGAGLTVAAGVAAVGALVYLAAAWRWRGVLQLDALRRRGG
jgi:O-antigen/teichoic acid export membrane protein